MIVFVAPFPALSDEKDGMMQRVASIDLLVSDLPRVYLDISFRRFWSKKLHHFGDATVFQLNGLWHFFQILSWLRKASVVYIHSVHNSIKVLPAYWVTVTITDLHGAVPEELAHQGKQWTSHIFSLVERFVMRRSSSVVHVTYAMKRHFQSKYQRQSEEDRIIAILPCLTEARGQCGNVMDAKRDKKAVIYAGGLQAWQNVPTMLEAAAAKKKLKYVFLSGETPVLNRLAESANVANFICLAVLPHQVPDYYLRCTYGFVLRDPVLLNKVACPTKLVEYLYWGVIPIVLTTEIGDFADLGFAFVTLEDFRASHLPSDNEAAQMRIINRQVFDRLIQTCKSELSTLRNFLRQG